MASTAAALGAAFAVAGGWIGPGLAVATALGLGRDRLERAVVGIAIGRLLLALAALAASAVGATSALVAWAALGMAAGAWSIARARRARDPGEHGLGAALAIGALCAFVLVHAVVFRSGIDRGGMLVFFGRDGANDPFVYGAYALALRDLGPPLANPFAGGAAALGSYLHFAVLAGLSAIAATPITDLAYRVVPLLDCAALMATAIALVRALGAPRLAWLLAPLALLAGDPAPVAASLLRVAGVATHPIDSFTLFGPYLLAMNPITPGLQTFFCALLLLARAPRRREAVAAGALVGALFEIKLFLWLPAIAGLAAAALVRPPPALRRPLALASAVAAFVSLPPLLDKLRTAAGAAQRDDTGFALCAACLPRYLLRAAWGDGELSFALFRAGTPLADVSPHGVLTGVLASAALVALALGARAFALPELVRGARDPERAAPYRVLGFAGAAGLALALVVSAPPHHLNAAQFSWAAVFGLAPLVAIACARWLAAGRWLPLALATLLAVPGAIDAIVRLGYGAPLRFAITSAEAALCARLAEISAPGDVVFEPSMLIDTDRPSPVPLLAGRPVHLSLLSAVGGLPPDARDARFARLAAFFAGADVAAARRALAESGARFVLVPAGVAPPRAALEPLELVFENAAGRLYRVPASASLAP
ncbi:MAG: hypothetical protein DCC71_12570 [Proteobacteria bacterium]|nr:MAG: hypothetical protein DCC71_12570 [Pseudomonadota bacterium]